MNKLKITGIALIAAAILTGGGYLVLKNISPRQRISGEAGVKIVHEALSFYNKKGQKINGRIYRPEGATGKLPTVVFCHGFGSTMSSGEDFCKAFASKGWNAYTFDFRGGSAKSTSDGSTMDMSVLTEIDDADLVLDKLGKEDFTDKKNIFLVGQSQGGEVAALTAASRKDVRGMVLLFPAFSIQDDARTAYPRIKDIPDSTAFGFIMVGKAYFKDTWKMDPYKTIGKYKGPVLIMHGTMDQMVNYSYSVRAKASYKDAVLETFEGAGHGFTGADRQRAITLATEFIDNNIRSRK